MPKGLFGIGGSSVCFEYARRVKKGRTQTVTTIMITLLSDFNQPQPTKRSKLLSALPGLLLLVTNPLMRAHPLCRVPHRAYRHDAGVQPRVRSGCFLHSSPCLDLELWAFSWEDFSKFVKSLSSFFGVEGCVVWNRQYGAVGLGNYLVRRCPWQMRGCAQVAGCGPHTEHDKICLGVQSLLQYAISG